MNTGGVGAAPSPNDVTDVLLAYMPRLVADWAQMTPDERWRPIRATVVFADLSGSTAMSERLARLAGQGLRDPLAVSAAAGYHYDIALITGVLGRNCVRADALARGGDVDAARTGIEASI